MYKYLCTTIIIFSLVYGVSFGQEKNSIDIQELQELFAGFSNQRSFRLEYIKEKETLYMTVKKDSIFLNGFKLLVKDIHPEGIFMVCENDDYAVRIIAINNGYMFIKEEFRNGFRLSNTTNYVDIIGVSGIDKAKDFISKLKEFVKSRTVKLKIKEDLEIYLPKTRN